MKTKVTPVQSKRATSGLQRLALHGGPKAKTRPYRKGQRFGREEMKELREALAQNTLFCVKGQKVKQFCLELAAKYGMKHAVATTSCTAAIHVALGAVGVTVGDEVITSVLTDAGTFMPILWQNAVPIFADIDPRTYNVTAETIRPRLTPRTKAIVVVHLAGNPADMDPILKLARRHKLMVIEDCAQTWNARYKGRWVGTMGHMGVYSLNDYKHISVGDGGAVVTNDELLAGRAAMLGDKCYPRDAAGMRAGNMCQYLASNYRMSELCGAVALAQLRKVDWICKRRQVYGKRLNAALAKVPGILPPVITPGGEWTNWYYLFRIDEKVIGATRDEFVKALAAEGLPAGFYLRRVDQYEMFQNHSIYPPRKDRFACPFDCPKYQRRPRYAKADCPNVDVVTKTGIILQMSEFYTDRDIAETAGAVAKVAAWYSTGRGAQ